MIEVEKKFTVTDYVLKNLKLLGAKLLKENSFTDVYHDTSCHDMTTRNFWLRQRDKHWQLKSPTGVRTAEEALMNSSYKESETELEIMTLIMPILCKTDDDKMFFLQQMGSVEESGKRWNVLPKVLENFNCRPFCSITTRRQTYMLGDFHIDLDTTDTGYQVGEIELLTNSEEGISSLTKRIDDLSQKLGIPLETQVAGKLGHYLKKHNPDHYYKLFKLKVLV